MKYFGAAYNLKETVRDDEIQRQEEQFWKICDRADSLNEKCKEQLMESMPQVQKLFEPTYRDKFKF